MKVIGIAGKAGSGKNTVAGILAGLLLDQEHTVHLDAIAVGIKRAAWRCGWNGKKDEAGRALLQRVGDEGRSSLGPEWWLDLLRLRSPLGTAEFLIVPDIRLIEEARWARRNGVLWWVSGRGGLSGPAAEHVTEMELRGLPLGESDTEIRNHGSIDELMILVKHAVADGRYDPDLLELASVIAQRDPPPSATLDIWPSERMRVALRAAIRAGQAIVREPFFDDDDGEYRLEARRVEDNAMLCTTQGHRRVEDAAAELEAMIAASR